MTILRIGLLLFQLQPGSITGMVTRPGGTEPLPGATVVLNPTVSTQIARIRSTVSEDDGGFTLRDIEPGEYRLQVQSAFYGSAAYGQRRSDGPGAILTIDPGQRLSDLRVSMVPTGAIAGRITGSSGEPLAYASVQALKSLYQDGKRTLAVVQTTTTDDRGEYRLFWLPAGRYVVLASPRSSPITTGTSSPSRPGDAIRTTSDMILTPIPLAILQASGGLLEGTNLVTRILEDGSVREESWMPTYYPATTDRGQATPVEVTVGATVTGIDVTLGPSPVQKIRGRVIVASPAGQVTVSLVPAASGMSGQMITKNPSPIDGSFEFAGVLPGPYYLAAQDRAAGLVSSPMPVLVGDRDVENVLIAPGPAVTVSVLTTTEGPESADQSVITGMLRADLNGPPNLGRSLIGPMNALIKPGSVTTFANVPAGEYEFDIAQGPVRENQQRFYVKAMRLGREDALGTFYISSDMKEALLEVLLTTGTGSVEGVALNRAGNPAANVTVVLVPTNARKRSALYKTLITGSDGRFRFQEIPPGDYKLFAWDEIETGAWQDAEFIRAYESRGRAVSIAENSKQEAQLDVIYNP